MSKVMRSLFVAAALVAAHFMGMAMATASAQSVDAPRAAELEKKAEKLQKRERGEAWEKAAEMYIEAASLRAAGDAQAVESLKRAANLLYFVQKPAEAMQAMEKAGDRAAENGDVLAAGHAYAQATQLAKQAGDDAHARALAEKLARLAASPNLRSDERAALEKLIAA